MSAHLRSPLPKNALTWAFVALMSTLGLVLAPTAASAATPAPPAAGAPPAAAEQALAPAAAAAAPAAAHPEQVPAWAATDTPRAATSAEQALARVAPSAPPAGAGKRSPVRTVSAASLSPAARLAVRGARIVAVAGAQRGKPYRRGAQGPGAFDCSGLSGYAYRAVHIRLPRTANEQYHAAHPIGRAAARPGDLVFWVSGHHAYHVAVYAGAGRVWHAPKPGDRVRLAKIWSTGQVRFGRIGA